MPDVRMPDGTIIKNVPEGTTKRQLMDRLERAGLVEPMTIGQKADQAVADVAGNLSGTEKFLVGAGRGATEVGQGALQLASTAVRPTSMIPVIGPAVSMIQSSLEGPSQFDQQVAAEAELIKPLEDSTAFTAGRIGGQIAATAPLGGPAAQAGKFVAGKVAQGAQTIGSRIAGGAAAGAAGGAGGGALQPTLTDNQLEERIGNTSVGATVGGAVGGAIPAVAAGIETVNPANIARRFVGGALNKADEANPGVAGLSRGDQVAQDAGMNLSPGARSESPAVTMLENAARQSFVTRDAAFAADRAVADQAVTRIGKLMDRLTTSQGSAESVGNRLQKATVAAVRKVRDSRDREARRLYGPINELRGGAPVQLTNAHRVAEQFAEEFQGVAGDVNRQLFQQAKAFADELADGMTLEKALANRRAFSKASAGAGNIFKDMATVTERRVARQLVEAIEQDFDQLAVGSQGTVKELLQRANNAYRQQSQVIDSIEGSVLGRVLGKENGDLRSVSPERALEMMRRADPSEVSAAVGILKWADPDTLQAVKRQLIEDALEDAAQDVASVRASSLAINPTRFTNFLSKRPKDTARLKVLFDPGEMREVDTVLDALGRWGDKTGFNASGTGPMNELLGMLQGVSVRGAATVVGKVAGLKSVANLMANPQNRKELLRLTTLSPKSPKAQAIAARIMSEVDRGTAITATRPTASEQ